MIKLIRLNPESINLNLEDKRSEVIMEKEFAMPWSLPTRLMDSL